MIAAASIRPGEASRDVVVLRVEGWRVAVPLSAVRRVFDAATPVLSPCGSGARAHFPAEERLVPIVFAALLLGAERVTLHASDKVVMLQVGEKRVALWVAAVEDVVERAPGHEGMDGAPATVCAGSTIALLDVEELVALTVGEERR